MGKGAELGRAAITGFNNAAAIHSPSRVMRVQARQLGAGAELGMEDSAPRVQATAEKTLVPRLAPGTRDGAGGGGTSSQAPIGPFIFHFGDVGTGVDTIAIERACQRAIRESWETITIALGRRSAA